MTDQQEHKIVEAVFYALRSGCFFPVREPTKSATTQDLIKWGALRHLHDVIAEIARRKEIL
mgnify:CR=1 FL=1